MSRHLKFVFTAKHKTTLWQIARGIKKIEPRFRFESEEYLVLDNEYIAQVDAGNEFFESDLEWLQEQITDDLDEETRLKVSEILDQATQIIVFNAVDRGRRDLSLFNPLCDWFFQNHRGVVWIDGNGFYTKITRGKAAPLNSP
jgi:hypothetical protein